MTESAFPLRRWGVVMAEERQCGNCESTHLCRLCGQCGKWWCQNCWRTHLYFEHGGESNGR